MKSYPQIICVLLLCLSSSTYAATLTNPFDSSHLTAASQTQSLTAAAPSAAAPALPLTPAETFATYALSYAQAKDVYETLNALYPGKLTQDAVTNSIIFCGTPAAHAQLQALLKQLDSATQQVTLEAKIIAVSRENSKDLGVNWEWNTIPQRSERSDSSKNSGNKDNSDSYGGNFKFWHGYAFRFHATLNALITSGKAKILATPRIITIPGREASIFIGDHIPVQTEKHDSSGTYTATEYLDAGIKLAYCPIISADGKMVTAKVHTEVSTPSLVSELKNYRITSRTADTNVRMYSGETLIIGGLISDEQQESLRRVPFLGDIPLLGELFKSRSKKSSTTEVMLLLTPHITQAGKSPAIYKEIIAR